MDFRSHSRDVKIDLKCALVRFPFADSEKNGRSLVYFKRKVNFEIQRRICIHIHVAARHALALHSVIKKMNPAEKMWRKTNVLAGPL